MKYGIIAGNGRFPILALETARAMGDEAVVIAIREEASPEIERLAQKCYWVSLGELSRLIEICHSEGVNQVMMAGQVKHAKIFSNIKPDWRLFQAPGRASQQEYRRSDRSGGQGASVRRH